MESPVINKIVENITAKAIENLDEGMLLKSDIEECFENANYDFASFDKFILRRKRLDWNERCNAKLPDKKDTFSFLAARFHTTLPTGDQDIYPDYGFENFHEGFREYWREKMEDLKTILKTAPEFLKSESISQNDLFFINVGYRAFNYKGKGSFHPKLYNTFEVINNNQSYFFKKESDCKLIEATFFDVFLFSSSHFIKLSLGVKGVLDRAERIIQRNIKKLNIVNNNMLEIFFHGFYDPETIILDDYKSALDLQRHLTNLRQARFDSRSQRQPHVQH